MVQTKKITKKDRINVILNAVPRIAVGETRYCLDPKTRKVHTATIIGSDITDEGYLVIRLKMGNDKTRLIDYAHVHETAEEAEQDKKVNVPLMEKVDERIQETKDFADETRLKIIGPPIFKNLAEQVKRG